MHEANGSGRGQLMLSTFDATRFVYQLVSYPIIMNFDKIV